MEIERLILDYFGNPLEVILNFYIMQCFQNIVSEYQSIGKTLSPTTIIATPPLSFESIDSFYNRFQEELNQLLPNLFFKIGFQWTEWVLNHSFALVKMFNKKKNFKGFPFGENMAEIFLEAIFWLARDENSFKNKQFDSLYNNELQLSEDYPWKENPVESAQTYISKYMRPHLAAFEDYLGDLVYSIKINNGHAVIDLKNIQNYCEICNSPIFHEPEKQEYYRGLGTTNILGSGSRKYANFFLRQGIRDNGEIKILKDKPPLVCVRCALLGIIEWRLSAERKFDHRPGFFIMLRAKELSHLQKADDLVKRFRDVHRTLEGYDQHFDVPLSQLLSNEGFVTSEKGTLHEGIFIGLKFEHVYWLGFIQPTVSEKIDKQVNKFRFTDTYYSHDKIPLLIILGALRERFKEVEIVDLDTLGILDQNAPIYADAATYYQVAQFYLKRLKASHSKNYSKLLLFTEELIKSPIRLSGRYLRELLSGAIKSTHTYYLVPQDLKIEIMEVIKLVQKLEKTTLELEFCQKLIEFLIEAETIPDAWQKNMKPNQLTGAVYDLETYINKHGGTKGLYSWLSHLEKSTLINDKKFLESAEALQAAKKFQEYALPLLAENKINIKEVAMMSLHVVLSNLKMDS